VRPDFNAANWLTDPRRDSWDDSDSVQSGPFPLRAEQLAFRHHEVYITFNTFHKLIHKDPDVKIDTIDGSPFDKDSWGLDTETGKALVNCDDNVVLGGHSFGGCTVVSASLDPITAYLFTFVKLSILSSSPPPEYLPIPIERAIILDPWLEPLPTPGPVPLLRSTTKKASNDTLASEADSVQTVLEENQIQVESTKSSAESPHPRMLVINSETFTIWKDHYARLEEIVKGWEPNGNSIITLGQPISSSSSHCFG